MWLAYSMDMYGLNPSMLLGLSSKETFTPVIYKDQDNSYFLVSSENDHFDCYASDHKGLCTDLNGDGPFQVETPSMSTDVSIFPQRFYTDDTNIPKKNRTPNFQGDNEIAVLPNFPSYHNSYTKDTALAVVLTSLDFHFRFNVISRLTNIGLTSLLDSGRTRAQKEALMFAAGMFTYNRGIYGGDELRKLIADCNIGEDPIKDCGLDGFGSHSTDIQTACHLLDTSSEVYDYKIYWNDVTWFMDKLNLSYPYESIPKIQSPIQWQKMSQDVEKIFSILEQHRQSGNKDSSSGISFRYDWRTMLGVMRAYLPQKEILMGVTLQNTDAYYESLFGKEFGPYVEGTLPVTYFATAGSHFKDNAQRLEMDETSGTAKITWDTITGVLWLLVCTFLMLPRQ